MCWGSPNCVSHVLSPCCIQDKILDNDGSVLAVLMWLVCNVDRQKGTNSRKAILLIVLAFLSAQTRCARAANSSAGLRLWNESDSSFSFIYNKLPDCLCFSGSCGNPTKGCIPCWTLTGKYSLLLSNCLPHWSHWYPLIQTFLGIFIWNSCWFAHSKGKVESARRIKVCERLESAEWMGFLGIMLTAQPGHLFVTAKHLYKQIFNLITTIS